MGTNTLKDDQLTGSQKNIIEQTKKESGHASLEFRMAQARNYMDGQIMSEVFSFYGVNGDPSKDNANRKKFAGELLKRISPIMNEMYEVMSDLREDLEAAERQQRILLFRSALMIDALKQNGIYNGEASKVPEGI